MSPQIKYKAFTSTRFFGVELDVNEKVDRQSMGKIIEAADPVREVVVTHGWNMTGVENYLPAQVWNVKTDSTCANGPGTYGHEVASPKMSGSPDIRTVGNVAESLAKGGCEVNTKCGVHIHADIAQWTTEQVGVMLAHWCRAENIIAQALPPHRRNNKYAKLMRKKHRLNYDETWTGASLYTAMQPTNLDVHHNYEKRVAINLIGYTLGILSPQHSRRTAEFRLPEGTLVREDVENWVRLYIHFIEECATRTMCHMKHANLQESLGILGLAGMNGEFLILSPELHETKVWFLKRILSYTNNPALFQEAIEHLNLISEPLEKYIEIPAEDPPAPIAA
jgi:hypothetical protein